MSSTSCGSFFERLLRLGVALGVVRPRHQPGAADRVQHPVHPAMAVAHPELALGQGADVEDAVGDNRIALQIGPGQHPLFEGLPLRGSQPRRRAAAVAIDQTRNPRRVVAADPDPQHIARHTKLFGRHTPLAALAQPRHRQKPRPHLAARLRPSRIAQLRHTQPFGYRKRHHRSTPNQHLGIESQNCPNINDLFVTRSRLRAD